MTRGMARGDEVARSALSQPQLRARPRQARAASVAASLAALALATSTAARAQSVTADVDAAAQPTSQAEAPDTAKAQAKIRLERGIAYYKEGRYKDAIDEFLEAHRLYPSPILSFNAARAYEKMGDSAGALRFYREYVRQAPEAPDRAAVERKVGELEHELQAKGVQQVTVLSTPEGATVSIDGKPIGVTPWTGQLYPGRHALVVQREGYEDARSDFELLPHRALDVRVTLRRVPARPAAAAPKATPPPRPPPMRKPPAEEPPRRAARPRPWTWAVLGAGAATLGAAGVFEILRRQSEEEVRTDRTQPEKESAFERMEKQMKTARVLAGIGAGVMVVGGVLLIVDLTPRRGGKRAAAGCAPELCGLFLEGSF